MSRGYAGLSIGPWCRQISVSDLSQYLQTKVDVEHVEFRNDEDLSPVICIIFGIMCQMPNLKTLDLRRSAVFMTNQDLCFPYLRKLLEDSKISSLKVKDKRNLGLGFRHVHGLLKHTYRTKILISAAKNTRLERLELSSYFQEPDSFYAADLMSTSSSLRVLKLQYCLIGDEHCNHLSRGLSDSRSITYLNLKNNQISDKGAEELARALLVNTTLRILDLDGNSIGSEGVMAIMGCIQKNTDSAIQELYMEHQYQEIHPINARHICQFLSKNCQLSKLSLDFPCSESLYLCEALKINTSLEEIHISNHNPDVWDEECMDLILNTIQEYNSSIVVAYLTPITFRQEEAMCQLVSRNKKNRKMRRQLLTDLLLKSMDRYM